MDKEKIFRKESIERISSPEQLHDYLRVTSPRIWMLLAAIIAFLLGFLVYASTTKMENTLSLKLTSEYGVLSAELPESQTDQVSLRMPVRVGGKTGYITDIIQNEKLRLYIDFDGGAVLEDGSYELVFEDKESLPKEIAGETLYASVSNGVILIYDYFRVLSKYSATERRVSLGEKEGTLRRAEPYSSKTVFVALDDEEFKFPDGAYNAEIVTESTTPMHFLMN